MNIEQEIKKFEMVMAAKGDQETDQEKAGRATGQSGGNWTSKSKIKSKSKIRSKTGGRAKAGQRPTPRQKAG